MAFVSPNRVVTNWHIVELVEHEQATRHVVGTFVEEGQFEGGIGEAGDPYISSPIVELNLASGIARSQSGREIRLGKRVTGLASVGDLPRDQQMILQRAERMWGLAADVEWRVVAAGAENTE